MDLSVFALIAIVVAWAIQYLNTSPKKHDLNPLFLIFYALGSAILAWDTYQNGSFTGALLNLGVFIFTVAILLKITK